MTQTLLFLDQIKGKFL